MSPNVKLYLSFYHVNVKRTIYSGWQPDFSLWVIYQCTKFFSPTFVQFVNPKMATSNSSTSSSQFNASQFAREVSITTVTSYRYDQKRCFASKPFARQYLITLFFSITISFTRPPFVCCLIDWQCLVFFSVLNFLWAHGECGRFLLSMFGRNNRFLFALYRLRIY